MKELGTRETNGGKQTFGKLDERGFEIVKIWKFLMLFANRLHLSHLCPFYRAATRLCRRLHGRQLCCLVRRRQRRSAPRAPRLVAPPGRAPRCPPLGAVPPHSDGRDGVEARGGGGAAGEAAPSCSPAACCQSIRISCASDSQSRGAVSSEADAEEAGGARSGAAGGRRGPRVRSDTTSSWSANRHQP